MFDQDNVRSRTLLILLVVVVGIFLLSRITGPTKFTPEVEKQFQKDYNAYAKGLSEITKVTVDPARAQQIIQETLARAAAALQSAPAVEGQPTAGAEVPTPQVAKTKYSDPRSQALLAPWIKKYFEEAPAGAMADGTPNKYWYEPGMSPYVECVALIKRYQRFVLGLDFSYLREPGNDNPYMVWPVKGRINGWPNYAAKVFVDDGVSVFDPHPPAGHDIITLPDGKKYHFHVVAIPPEMANQLEFGDILMWGSVAEAYAGTAGHTGLFAGYPDGPEGSTILQLDENGGKGSESRIPEDAIQFHAFPKTWLNDAAIAIRVILDDEVQ